MSEEFIAQPEATEVPVTPVEQEQTPTAPTEQLPTESAPYLHIKHLDKEYDLSADDAKVYAQKGFDYDRIRTKYDESKPVLSFLEKLAKEQGYSNTTEYVEAAKEWKKQQKLQELVQQNIPEEYAKEIMENRTFREQYTAEQKATQDKLRQNQEFDSFLLTYPDVKAEDIPKTVWDEFAAGKSLVDSYAKVEVERLKQELAEAKKGLGIVQKNAENAQSSTGAITGQGEVSGAYFTEAQVDAMSPAETAKNLDKIYISMKTWKKN